MMGRHPNPAKQAIILAAAPYRRPDGTYPRQRLAAIAGSNRISLTTLRGWLADETPAGAKPVKRARLKEDEILVALASTGSKLQAWELCTADYGYEGSYRTFLRDLDSLPQIRVRAAIDGRDGFTGNAQYIQCTIPHRNHSWYLDHTMGDIWVQPTRGKRAVRPWITVIVDGATGMFMMAEAWLSHPNTETVSEALTRGASGDHYGSIFVGGLPLLVRFDNAKEHMAAAVRDGCIRLGVAANLNTPYASWENGKVERAHLTMQRRLLATLPGYTGGGEGDKHDPRFGLRSDQPPEGVALLSFEAFRAMLEEWRIQWNAEHVGNDGRSAVDRWTADQTALTEIDPELMRANITVEDNHRIVQSPGLLT